MNKNDRYVENHLYNNDLTSLKLKKVTHIGDFRTEEVALEIKGVNLDEASKGMDKLVDTFNKLNLNVIPSIKK